MPIAHRIATIALALTTWLSAHAAIADEWSLELTPYLFATGLNGDGGVAGLEAGVDMSFNDIWDSLDSAFMGIAIARNGAWSAYLDGVYARLENSVSVNQVVPTIGTITEALDSTITQQVYHLALGYRIVDGAANIDLVAGARFTDVDIELDLAFDAGPISGRLSKRDSASWYDPIIGVRFDLPLDPAWSVVGYFDAGPGFGDSDGSFQALIGLDWRGRELWNAKFGYRYLSVDYADGSDGVLWDMTMQGLYLGIGFHF